MCKTINLHTVIFFKPSRIFLDIFNAVTMTLQHLSAIISLLRFYFLHQLLVQIVLKSKLVRKSANKLYLPNYSPMKLAMFQKNLNMLHLNALYLLEMKFIG